MVTNVCIDYELPRPTPAKLNTSSQPTSQPINKSVTLIDTTSKHLLKGTWVTKRRKLYQEGKINQITFFLTFCLFGSYIMRIKLKISSVVWVAQREKQMTLFPLSFFLSKGNNFMSLSVDKTYRLFSRNEWTTAGEVDKIEQI